MEPGHGDGSGDQVLSGLAGHIICSHLNTEQLRTLSECSKHLNVLSIGSVRSLVPKKLPEQHGRLGER